MRDHGNRTKIHKLKTWPSYFQATWNDAKHFEIRKDDREFRMNDDLRLMEWDPAKREYTGREIYARVTCVVDGVPEWGLMEGYCIMSIRVTAKYPGQECY